MINKLLNFTNHLTALLEDDESLRELEQLYPKQREYIFNRYRDQNYVEYYLCLVHLCNKHNVERYRLGNHVFSLSPALKEEK